MTGGYGLEGRNFSTFGRETVILSASPIPSDTNTSASGKPLGK